MVFISTNNQQDIGSLTDHRGFPQPTTELLRFYGIYGWFTTGYLCNIIGYDGIYIYNGFMIARWCPPPVTAMVRNKPHKYYGPVIACMSSYMYISLCILNHGEIGLFAPTWQTNWGTILWIEKKCSRRSLFCLDLDRFNNYQHDIDGWMDWWMDGWIDGSVDRWMDGWLIYGYTDR